MRLIILLDNNSRINKNLLSEPGLSFYIEDDNKKVLFDCGYSDVFIKNAYKLGINLKTLDYIVLSHSHNDHTGGLSYLHSYYQDLIDMDIVFKNPILVAHCDIFEPKIYTEIGNVGVSISQDSLKYLFDIKLTNKPYFISEKLCFLGEIKNNKSLCKDDSALAYNSPEGLVIVTGCSHSGIINIVEQAKGVFDTNKVKTIIGGMHLYKADSQELENIKNYFQEQKITTIYPTHCCNLYSKMFLSKYIDVQEVCTGDAFHF